MSTKCEPSKQNVSDFITVRSPLITLLCCVFLVGPTYIVYGNLIETNNLLQDPDVTIDWNQIFGSLRDCEYCLTKDPFQVPDQGELKTNYDRVSLTSRVSYTPAKNYYENSDYHNESSGYPLAYGFTLKPTDIGLLPLEQPRGNRDATEHYNYKKESTIFVTVEFHSRYNSSGKCKIVQESDGNKYFPDKTHDAWQCESDNQLYACYNFYFHKVLFNHTTDLQTAKIPEVDVQAVEKQPENCLDQTFACSPNVSSKLGHARYQDRAALGEHPCSSRLYFHAEHAVDPSLVKMLTQTQRETIHTRLFWSGFVLILVCASFMLWASFRGSTHAIEQFERQHGRNTASFTERTSTENAR